MDNFTRHHIRHQVIELDLLNGKNVTQLQSEISEFVYSQLVPQMEGLFDSIAGPDKILHFNQLVLDLGDIGESNWKNTLCSRLLSQLRDKLGQPVLKSAGSKQQTAESMQDPVEISFKQFMYFLEHGRLPWWGRRTDITEFGSSSAQWRPHHWKTLMHSVSNNSWARLRLVYNLSDEFLGRLVESANGILITDQLLSLLAPLPSAHVDYIYWRHYFWNSLLKLIDLDIPSSRQGQEMLLELVCLRMIVQANSGHGKEGSIYPKTDHFIEPAWLNSLPSPWKDWFEAIDSKIATLDQRQPGSTLASSWREIVMTLLGLENITVTIPNIQISALFRQLLAGDSLRQLIANTQQSRTSGLQTPQSKQAAPSPLEARVAGIVNADTPQTNEISIDAEERLIAPGAGLIIVHPFLVELFEDQKLLHGKSFRDEVSRQQAVKMLTYLGFGEIEIQEYDLLLPKLLCDMPWQTPLLLDAITDKQRQACDELLQAVLKHWQALKTNSSQWLREQFFWREGKLKQVDNGWQLNIERRAQDILLDKLPWGTGVIKLPWLSFLIYARWQE